MPELKPCPFCGGKDIEIIKFDVGSVVAYIANCQKCFAQTGFCQTPETAKEAWNTREDKRSAYFKEGQKWTGLTKELM